MAQICGYYRQEEVARARLTDGQGAAKVGVAAMTNALLVALIGQGAATVS